MKYFALDWQQAFAFLEVLGKVTPATRLRLARAELKAIFEAHAFGDDLRLLSEAGIVVAPYDGTLTRIGDRFHETHKLLRALQRVPLLPMPLEENLGRYILEHFDEDERFSLGRALHDSYGHAFGVLRRLTSAAHVRGLLEARNPATWEDDLLERMRILGRGSKPTARLTVRSGADLALLVQHLVGGPGSLCVRELRGLFPELDRPRLALAVELGLRYGVLFAGLDALHELRLFLWPSVHARLRQGRPARPSVTPLNEGYAHAFALDDLQHLLVSAGDGLRMKSSGFQLFAAAEREFVRGLTPLPEWLHTTKLRVGHSLEQRVESVLEFATSAHFVQPREEGRATYLEVSDEGWDWLALDPRARHAYFLAPLRAALAQEEEEPDGFSERSFPVLLRTTQFVPSKHEGAVPRVLREIFGGVGEGQAVPIGPWLVHHASASNPLPKLMDRRSRAFEDYTEEDLEDAFFHDLRGLLFGWLLPFGGARVGLSPTRELAFELTSIGRYLLGLAPDFELSHAREESMPVRVQPDFEVVFVSPSPMLEARIGRFAERRGKGVGVLFRITKDAVLSAARSGLTAGEVLTTLRESSATPLPTNVVHELEAWFARCRRVESEVVQLLRCPDPETAERVLAVGSRYLELVAPTLLALRDPSKRSELVRACAKQGLFLA